MSTKDLNQTIIRYYERTSFDYFLVLRLWKHWGKHYGFFDRDHKTVEEAILNLNKVLAEKAEIHKGAKVLDAGCGVGGSSIWLAKNKDARVTGITIVEQECKKAKELARKYKVGDKTEFLVRDYCNTGFPNSTFDLVWAIESVCHAEDKSNFLKEAIRILKPGGKLIVADGFQKKLSLTVEEQDIMHKWLSGWAVPNLATVNGFKDSMRKVGFKKIESEDVVKNILPFSRWLYKGGMLAYPLAKLLEWLKIRSKEGTGNVVAAIWQYHAINKNLATYEIFLGTK